MVAKLMLLNKKAFTYIEMLLVLFITSLILFGGVISITNINEKNILNQNVKVITSIYDNLKNHANFNNTKCYLKVESSTIESSCDINYMTKTRTLEKASVSSNFIKNTIKINENGNIQRAGSITVKTKNYEKKISFGIGFGNYVIK